MPACVYPRYARLSKSLLRLCLLALFSVSPTQANETIDDELATDNNSSIPNSETSETAAEAPASETPARAQEAPAAPAKPRSPAQLGVEAVAKHQPQVPFPLLKDIVSPGTRKTLQWSPQDMFEGIPMPTPVLVANGIYHGPVLCLTGAIHGDEINSVETIRRVFHTIDPRKLTGTVVGVPIVNQMGFRRSSRYLPDRRDLNRYFPGTARGSSASRIAYSLFHEIIGSCDALVDLHTGSFHRTNVPQLRADLKNPAIKAFAGQFGEIVVLHGSGANGTLRREAARAGIPAVTLEAGEALRIQEDVIDAGVKHVNTLLTNMKMVEKPFFWSHPQPVYMESRWLRAETGGMFISNRKPGDKVKKGDKLGRITDPITNMERIVLAEFSGKIIGMALNQVVLPGYAIYHVGVDATALSEGAAKLNQNRDNKTPAKDDNTAPDSDNKTVQDLQNGSQSSSNLQESTPAAPIVDTASTATSREAPIANASLPNDQERADEQDKESEAEE